MQPTFPAPPLAATPGTSGLPPGRTEALRAAARELEAGFLAEMLKHSGVARPPATGNGGPGEEAFASFLSDAYARKLAETGGLGLAEHIFNSLLARESAAK